MTDSGRAFPAASKRTETRPGLATSSEPRAPSLLWVEALQELASLVAHDLRNALNAVAVNLEVVRTRSARGAEASGIAPFAATAASNFESAAAATEALLALARAEPAPVVDVAAVATRIARLVSVRAQNAVQVVDRSGGRATTEISSDMVRAAVARSVLTALSASERIACEITVDDGIFVRVTGATADPPLPDSELAAAALAYGIHFASRGQSLEIRIPTVDQRANQHVPS